LHGASLTVFNLPGRKFCIGLQLRRRETQAVFLVALGWLVLARYGVA